MKFKVTESGTTNTYVYCWEAATRALVVARRQEPGHFYFSMVAGVFAAFTVEAYLNHVGQETIPSWADVERKLGVREKLLLLRDLAHWSVDEGTRPFQSLRDMLQLRDSLAHGKTVTVEANAIVETPPPDSLGWPEPKWMAQASLSSVERLVADAEGIVRELSRQSGETGNPFLSPGRGSGSVELIRDGE